MMPETLVKTASVISSWFSTPSSEPAIIVGPSSEHQERLKTSEDANPDLLADDLVVAKCAENEAPFRTAQYSSNTAFPEPAEICDDTCGGIEKTAVEYEHLVMMVHGVSGDPDNFAVLKEVFEGQLQDESVLIVRSQANRKEGSHDGVEACGQKLAREVRRIVGEHKSLKRISFVAFSIGGLFSRYACGVAFDPKTKTVFGLEPCHFLSIASPHLGCHVEGEAQVPFIGWGLRVPYVDMVLKPVFDLFAASVTKIMYGASGRHLFLDDGDAATEPTILKLVLDIPGEGHFFSSLAQFRTRVCYANACGDALVGWANASVRKESELPREKCEELELIGVVAEAPLQDGCWGNSDEKKLEGLADPRDGLGKEHSVGDFLILNRKGVVRFMLSKLQMLPWCRIDVAIKNTFLAHTNIIVARKTLDSVGLPVVEHMAHRFSDLERMVKM
ncbi:hypothetical protein BSKO_01370 [Bryopsis sp. KO-2023]|nr:hypothetical protein BSKO_01370 [Bryopsis sp. KO-2023]